ncbi:MAG: dihydrofolate reductase family protein [Candidatus Aminicenantales bacterium]
MIQHTGKPGIVLWHVTMSLDGFIAGPGDTMDWIFKYRGPNPEAEAVIRTTGAVLVGRRSYEVGKSAGIPPEARKVYGGAWTGPQFVLTHRPPDFEEDPSISFVSGDIRVAIARARAAALGKNVVLIGASIARQSIDAGLVDEILVHLAPVLLGGGVPLFSRPGMPQVELTAISATRAGKLTNLRFQVMKEAEPVSLMEGAI